MFALTSFGNMGFAQSQCSREYLNIDHGEFIKLNFMCQKTTVVSSVSSVGILLSKELPRGSDNALSVCHTDLLQKDSVS